MAGAGLRYDDYPAASSDDAMERESIIPVAPWQARMDGKLKLSTRVFRCLGVSGSIVAFFGSVNFSLIGRFQNNFWYSS
jgi:hypothetical protein